jgi:hypothetical protein
VPAPSWWVTCVTASKLNEAESEML